MSGRHLPLSGRVLYMHHFTATTGSSQVYSPLGVTQTTQVTFCQSLLADLWTATTGLDQESLTLEDEASVCSDTPIQKCGTIQDHQQTRNSIHLLSPCHQVGPIGETIWTKVAPAPLHQILHRGEPLSRPTSS